MKKLYAIFGIIFLIILSVTPLVSASYVCPADCPDPGSAYTVQLRHAMPSVLYPAAAGNAFTANTTCYLYSATFKLWAGAGDATFCARLYAVQGGTVGTDAYPTSTVLAQSNTYDATALSGSESDFTFTFDGTYHLISGTNYVMTVEIVTFTSAVINAHQGAGSATINGVIHQSGVWTTYAGKDMYMIINADTTGSGATPTPAPSTTPDDFWNGSIGTTISGAIGLILPLLFMFIPAFFFYKFAGAWGFFAGINIGVILSYLFIPAMQQVWIIVVLVIVDGLLLFGKVGLHD